MAQMNRDILQPLGENDSHIIFIKAFDPSVY